MNNVKVRTILESRYGTTVTFGGGKAKFDEKGVAELPEDLAKKLVEANPKLYYLDGQKPPVLEQRKQAPPIDKDFQTKFSEAEKEGKIERSSAFEQQQSEQTQAAIQAAVQAALAEQREMIKAEVRAELNAEQTPTTTAASNANEEEVELTEEIASENAEIAQSTEEVTDEHAGLRDQLRTMKEEEIKELLEEGKVDSKAYAKITDKEELIDFTIKQEIL